MVKIKKYGSFLNEQNENDVSIEPLTTFLSQFPDNATDWSDATDELRDTSRFINELYNALTDGNVVTLDFNKLGTPSEWNIESKKYILDLYNKLDIYGKKQFIEYIQTFYN